MTPVCRGTAKSGAPCRATISLSPEGLCPAHDPDRAEQMRAMRAAGARAISATLKGKRAVKGIPGEPKSLKDAVRFSSWLARATIVYPDQARAFHESTAAVKVFASAIDKRDLQKRLTAALKVLARIEKCPACSANLAAAVGDGEARA